MSGLFGSLVGRGGTNPVRAQVGGLGGEFRDLNDPALLEFLRGGAATASGAYVGEAAAMRVAAAWRCVHIICGGVANMPVDLYRRVSERERQPAEGHPLRAVLHRPNSWQTPQDFKRMLTASAVLRGDGYALKVMAGRRLLALWPMRADRVQVTQNPDMSLTYQYTRADGPLVRLGQQDVFHLRGLTLDGVNGVGVLKHARESLGLTLQAEQAGARLFRQGVLAGGALEHPQSLSEEAYARLKASIEEHNAGAENAHKFLILEEGMKIGDSLMSAEDAQFLETRKFQRSDIAMFFGVPPHMIGDTEKATSWGSGIEQQGIGYVAYTLQDWITAWEEAIARDLIGAAEPELYVKFSTAGLLRADAKTRWETYAKGRQMKVLSANDVRALEDMNPVDGGDVYENPLINVEETPAEAADRPERQEGEAGR